MRKFFGFLLQWYIMLSIKDLFFNPIVNTTRIASILNLATDRIAFFALEKNLGVRHNYSLATLLVKPVDLYFL
jgi:hypothetical protein